MNAENIKGIIVSTALKELPHYVSPQWVEALTQIWPHVEPVVQKAVDEMLKVRIEAATVEIRDERK